MVRGLSRAVRGIAKQSRKKKQADAEEEESPPSGPRSFPQEVKVLCWQKAETVKGRDPARWRRDPVGNLVFRKLVGCSGCLCYDYDHVIPYSKDKSFKHGFLAFSSFLSKQVKQSGELAGELPNERMLQRHPHPFKAARRWDKHTRELPSYAGSCKPSERKPNGYIQGRTSSKKCLLSIISSAYSALLNVAILHLSLAWQVETWM